MKGAPTMRRHRRLAIPQHEFGFTPDTFNLIQDDATDGERIARERAEADKARERAEQAQPRMFIRKERAR
jgi:hypothetical protein